MKLASASNLQAAVAWKCNHEKYSFRFHYNIYYNNNNKCKKKFVFKITFFHMSSSCYIIRSQGLGGAPHYSRHFSCMERTSQGDFRCKREGLFKPAPWPRSLLTQSSGRAGFGWQVWAKVEEKGVCEQDTDVYSHAGCLNSAKESVWFLLFVFSNHNFIRWTPFAFKKKREGGGGVMT